MNDRTLQRHRDKRAADAGEGSYLRVKDGIWFPVEVTFYPKVQLWITEDGTRRKVTREELARDYRRLEL